jgi:FAD-linked oxidoreductase
LTQPKLTRRDFVRTAVAASAAGLLPGCKPTSTGAPDTPQLAFVPGAPLPWINWAGNQACRPAARLAPQSEDELASIFQTSTGTLRPVGAGHSFTAVVPTDGTLIAADRMSGLVATDTERGTSEIWAGTRLHQLGPMLQSQGRALWNMPDIDYQTLGGATATSTHGTGVEFGSLSSYIEGLALVTPSGDVIECDRTRNPEIFQAARCSVGALGVVTRITMKTRPAFRLVERMHFEELESVLADIDERVAEVPYLEFFAFPHSTLAMVQATSPQDPEPEPRGIEDPDVLYALREAYRQVGGIPWIGDALYDMGLADEIEGYERIRVGPSYAVLTHDRIGAFREMEYTIPAEAGPECLREILRTIREQQIPVAYPIEYRYVRQDDVWLSMFDERDGCTISIHQFADEDHRAYFAAIEPIFWKYDGRPHWGKLHTLEAPQLAALYPHWNDFLAVREALDPDGRMLNAHLRAVFGVA